VTAKFRRPSPRLAILLGVGLMFIAYTFFVEPVWIEVTRHEAWFKRLPPEFDGLVVAHLSDLHMTRYGLRERRLLRVLEKAKPGVVVMTGDFISPGSDHAAAHQFLKDLRGLAPPFGLWAVLGNHEHSDRLAEDADGMRRFFNEAGVSLLVNEAGRIGRGVDTMTLLGVDDPYSGHDRLWESLKGMQRTPFAILLSHSPEIFFKADLARIDLVFAGHTHGGQVRLPWLGPLWLPAGSESYASGWYAGSSAKMFVTRGVGTSLVPMRFLCRPEVPLITLKRGAKDS
jgi:predicted MPP superfamily phosphohydrolase